MNGPYKFGIRRKLFIILVVVLLLNVVVLIFMGSTLFRGFYLQSKITEIKGGAKNISEAYEAAGGEVGEIYETIREVENRNSIVAILSTGEQSEAELLYFSRFFTRDGQPVPPEEIPPPAAVPTGESAAENTGTVQAENGPNTPYEGKQRGGKGLDMPLPNEDETLLEKLPTLTGPEIIDEDEGFGGHITLLSPLGENTYLYIQTPKGYIKSVADLAVRYTAYLSGGILLVGAAGLYLLAGRVAKPIGQIQNVADKISRLDFSQECPVHSNDELGALSQSINNMAAELHANIEKLVAANEVLQGDLLRQQETDRMRRQFIANVSHDFKTPLTLIISYAEAMGDEDDGVVREEYRETILEEGHKLSGMVNQLLRLSQLECGMNKLALSPFCISDVLDSVAAEHRILAEQKQIRVEKRYGGEGIVRADYQKITQVVTNLYENALKYGDEGGCIMLLTQERLEGTEKKCIVSVQNIGPKIPEEELSRVFESFYRADRARTRDSSQSFGLGLAIVRAILTMHGESCQCENLADGVRFSFSLPLAELLEGEESL